MNTVAVIIKYSNVNQLSHKKKFKHFSLVPDIDDCDPRNSKFIVEDQVAPVFCGQHGKCIDGLNEYSCLCDRGWTGKECTVGM